MSRPQVSVYNGTESASSVALPAIFSTPIRLDLVHSVFVSMNKNKRQAYAVASNAGEQTSAESWGTGRAVARIPRVGGSGTFASGQAAFGNMCRSGRMFAPTKTWRKWHVKINQNEKRYATAAAVAASGVAPLVLARGHRVEKIPEVPLVVKSDIESITKTKEAVALLKSVGAYEDVLRVEASRTMNAGKGKYRGRRFTQRRGPLVIYKENKGIVNAFRNVPGVELASVDALNLLQLAPGSHLGRFVIWTESAFKSLDDIWSSKGKVGYELPKNIISNADVTGIINSAEIQAVLRAKGDARTARVNPQKRNPLKNKAVLARLNPYATAFAEKKLGSEKAPESKGKGSKEFKKALLLD
ncbi:ribosomal 60S subunit protein L4A [Starmerella bacillaris]|uniref:Ribosomal 60S subunit protein L4A n=1 Tax=Starmerella bacillaris TaxID=1247836 RepID=A0AAV5RDB6_STABA|nr:ribosomal 60S subunit protein L4A [Starmerella bacillaris]